MAIGIRYVEFTASTKYGTGEAIMVRKKKSAPILAEGFMPCFEGRVGYPVFKSPSKLSMSLNTLPPMLPMLINERENEATLTL